MPLNYSKWDQLELSDDSDIEGHPNVDKRSLIRWKQRDIHEKRDQRNARIAYLEAEIACDDVLLARLRALSVELAQGGGAPRFSAEVERLRTNPSPEAPKSNAPKPVSYDAMILNLLEQVAAQAREKAAGDQEKLGRLLEDGVRGHVQKLGEEIAKLKRELDGLYKEKAKHITTEDIHEGFDSKYVPAPPAPEPVVKPKTTTKTQTKTNIEVLNPAASSSPPIPSVSTPETDEPDELDDDLPEMTPALEAFARLPLWDFEVSWAFIQGHREVVVNGASDALLLAAFRNQTDGKTKLAKQCVHQSLLLQYGDKLGADGLRLFFQRMIQGGQAAHAIFRKDVEDTYAHIQRRVEATRAEEDTTGAEQIQLVAENPETSISFNVPDGPPPENITLEGPGTEGMDIEDVRRALQMRWDLFSALSPDLQEALKGGELEGVNRVLGKMPVPEAEEAVKMMDMGGILNFAEEGIRDLTGKAQEEEEEEEEEEDETNYDDPGEDDVKGKGKARA